MQIINANVLDYIQDQENHTFDMVFADPPDNIGLDYGQFKDSISDQDYYNQLSILIQNALRLSPTFWLSYYWKHDLDIKAIIYRYKHNLLPTLNVKTFIWRFTFGQHNQNDCGSGFRFLVRMSKFAAPIYPDNIREMSERQRRCDKRASTEGRVPDDVWEFPRVCGNHNERRTWHSTQHPEGLMKRIILLSTKPGDKVLDLYSGTGTTLRACRLLDRDCVGVEIDLEYCDYIRKEM